jgi:exopolysaccharide biosynthesis polyprenyl glycosylphosphotransferase
MEPSGAVAKGGHHKTDRPTHNRSGDAVHRAQSILETNAVVPEGTSSARQLKRDAAYRRSLAVSDLLAVAFATALALAPGNTDSGLAVFAALPVVILVSKAVGLYDRDGSVLHKTTLDEVPKLFQVSTLYALSASIASPVFLSATLRASEVATLWALLFGSLVIGRCAVRALIKRIAPPERCLALGSAAITPVLREKLADNPSLRIDLIGRVPLTSVPGEEKDDVLGSLDTLGTVLVEHDIDRVIIAPGPDDDEQQMLHTIRHVKALGARVTVVPRLFEVVGSSVEFDYVRGMMLLGVKPYGLTASSRFLKRAMDVTAAALGLVVLSPLLAYIALAIKLTSPGPVLFRQRRIGRDGTAFDICKFRTMVVGADEQKDGLRHLNETEGLFKISDDPRVTRVGSFLRRSSLDELPQLWNVIRGDMSLVGPRPLVPDEDCQVHGLDRRRLHVLPGMTGFWQVFGSGRIPLQEMVKIDYHYGANWSLWQDCKILLRTVPYVIKRRSL